MISLRANLLIIRFFVFIGATIAYENASFAQDPAELFNRGMALEKEFRDAEALKIYQQVLTLNGEHAGALSHASRMLSNMAGRMENGKSKKEYVERAHALAFKAVQLDKCNKDTHLSYVIALGLLADVASSPREKILHAKTIHSEAELLIRLDSLYAPGYYVLGKWNLSLATLSWLEKLACDFLSGGLPENASLENAIRCFDKAIALQPNYIIFHYNRALAYYHQENYTETLRSLNKAFMLPEREPDDKIRLDLCRALLNETRKSL